MNRGTEPLGRGRINSVAAPPIEEAVEQELSDHENNCVEIDHRAATSNNRWSSEVRAGIERSPIRTRSIEPALIEYLMID
jgi:hypothetical protein